LLIFTLPPDAGEKVGLGESRREDLWKHPQSLNPQVSPSFWRSVSSP
jgi:hypothetical protein